MLTKLKTKQQTQSQHSIDLILLRSQIEGIGNRVLDIRSGRVSTSTETE